MCDIKENMNVLISNDDGINSSGLIKLTKLLSKKHNVLVVAPDTNQSSKSHSLTIGKPLTLLNVQDIGNAKAYSLSGTPVDCIKFAHLHFKEFKPDIVVGGINTEHNIGSDILYSATVAIALEASFFGHISFAFSATNYNINFSDIYPVYAEKLIDCLMPLSNKGDVWSINFPDLNKTKIKGVKFAKLGKHLYSDRYERIGENQYKLVGELIDCNENDEDCDAELIKKGYITITPILYNKTNLSKLNVIKDKELNFSIDD